MKVKMKQPEVHSDIQATTKSTNGSAFQILLVQNQSTGVLLHSYSRTGLSLKVSKLEHCQSGRCYRLNARCVAEATATDHRNNKECQ